VVKESITPSVDIASGKYLSIAQYLKQSKDNKFGKFKRSIDDNLLDPLSNHIKRITVPLVCPGKLANCVVHAEDQQQVLQFYSTESLTVLKRMQIPTEGNKSVRVLCIACQEFTKREDVIGESGTTCLFAVLCSNSRIYLYIKSFGDYRFWRSFETGEAQTKIWFLEK
jgi:hypothetical protein